MRSIIFIMLTGGKSLYFLDQSSFHGISICIGINCIAISIADSLLPEVGHMHRFFLLNEIFKPISFKSISGNMPSNWQTDCGLINLPFFSNVRKIQPCSYLPSRQLLDNWTQSSNNRNKKKRTMSPIYIVLV